MNTQSQHAPKPVTDGQQLPLDWRHSTSTVLRSLGNSRTMTFGLVTIRAGHANPRHRHPNGDEILHLVAGQIEPSLGVERFLMSAGDPILMLTGAFYNARAPGEEDAQMVNCFSCPDRESEGK